MMLPSVSGAGAGAAVGADGGGAAGAAGFFAQPKTASVRNTVVKVAMSVARAPVRFFVSKEGEYGCVCMVLSLW